MSLLDNCLDATVVGSFGRGGFVRHQRAFAPTPSDALRLSGKVCLVTGASSGIGLMTAMGVARQGAHVYLLVRNLDKGKLARALIMREAPQGRVTLACVDVASLASIRQFVERFSEPEVDVLVNNAGVMPPAREESPDGLELTFATNVVGPFLLTTLLLPRLRKSKLARVLTVSSGGMLTQKLDLQDVDWKKRSFDGVTAYAQSKRAEVVLNELWAQRLGRSTVAFHAMHPGWVDTPSLRQSMPGFYRITKSFLRTPEQGADTLVWLSSEPKVLPATGGFWFDRQPARTHWFPWTRETPQVREQLFELVSTSAGVAHGQVR